MSKLYCLFPPLSLGPAILYSVQMKCVERRDVLKTSLLLSSLESTDRQTLPMVVYSSRFPGPFAGLIFFFLVIW